MFGPVEQRCFKLCELVEYGRELYERIGKFDERFDQRREHRHQLHERVCQRVCDELHCGLVVCRARCCRLC